MSKRRAEQEEWERYKNLILQLYINEDATLSNVIHLMGERHGFVRKKGQYERAFIKWDVHKNSKAEIWRDVFARTNERTIQGRNSEVQIHGKVMSERRLRKERTRYVHMSAWDRALNVPHVDHSSTMSLAVRIRTPSPSPRNLSPKCMGLVQVGSTSLTPVNKFTHEMLFECAKATPWQGFMRFIKQFDQSNPGTLLHLPPKSEAANSIASDSQLTKTYRSYPIGIHMDTAVASKEASYNFQTWIYDSVSSMYVDWETVYLILNSEFIFTHIDWYLPPNSEGMPDINKGNIHDITHRSTQLEFLKTAVCMISGNHDDGRLAAAVVDLCQNLRNQSFLQHLLQQNLPEVHAFAEKLLPSAVYSGDLPLMRMLLGAGMDVNAIAFVVERPIYPPGQYTAVECAIVTDNKTIFELCLHHGADLLAVSNRRKAITTAAVRGFTDIAKMSLTTYPIIATIDFDTYTMLLKDFVSTGNIEISKLLIEGYPNATELIRPRAFIYFEEAAIRGDIAMIDYLLQLGLDMNATDSEGHGSPLAAAVYTENDEEFLLALLHRGAYVNSVLATHLRPLPGRPVAYTAGRCAVHMLLTRLESIEWNHYPVLRTLELLLEHGADPNQRCCETTPLDVAVVRGHFRVVKALLELGAEIPSEPAEYEQLVVRAFESRNHELIDFVLDMRRTSIDNTNLFGECIWRCGYDFALHQAERKVFSLQADKPPLALMPFAICAGEVDLVKKLLVRCKVEMGYTMPDYLTAGLALAANAMKPDMVRLFLDMGVRPYTPLPQALYWNGRVLEHNALHVSLLGSFGPDTENPLCLQLLLHACARCVQPPEEEYNRKAALRQVFQLVLFRPHNATIISTLLSVDMEMEDFERYPEYLPLQTAIVCSFPDLTQSLLQRGACVNFPAASYFDTALQMAVRRNDVDLVQTLIEKGAGVNAHGKFVGGKTALQYAAFEGNFNITNILLREGANVNALPCPVHGRTAIEGAAERGHLNMVKYLLELGADVQGRHNQNYRRTMYQAWNSGHRALARMIQDWKISRYGQEDVDSIENILQTMTQDELHYASADAKKRYEADRKREEEYKEKVWKEREERNEQKEFQWDIEL